MARAAKYGVFPVFRGLDGSLAVQPELTFPSEDDARRAAEVFAGVLGGAVAFSRMADEETGTVEEGVIIGKYGVMAEAAEDEEGDGGMFAPPQNAA
jgi:hypothetical protein